MAESRAGGLDQGAHQETEDASRRLANDPLPIKFMPLLQQQLGDVTVATGEANKKLTAIARKIQETVELVLISTTSAVRRLPPEVIASIMAFATISPYGLTGKGRVEFQNLRGVSRLWRRTAFSTPLLWRNLTVTLKQFNRGDGSAQFSRALDSWFSRGGKGADFTLAVGGQARNRTAYPQDVLSWITSTRTTLGMLALFDVHFSFSQIENVFRAAPPSLSSITTLFMSFPLAEDYDTEGSSSIDTTPTFPHLQDLMILDAVDGITNSLSHQHLTYLDLSWLDLAVADIANIFRCFPSLRRFGLTQCRLNTGDASDQQRTCAIHPTVQELRLRGGGSSPLLQALTFPALKKVALTEGNGPKDDNFKCLGTQEGLALGTLIQRSSLSVVTLGIEYPHPIPFLNAVLSSSDKVKVIAVGSLSDLGIGNNSDGQTKLSIPSTVQGIQCSQKILKPKHVEAIVITHAGNVGKSNS
ncbi:hypothetical protein BKA70DRAFT_1222484 [Coprinopsis sp. MPI-PUGE-AT-0042]|nr:hypothetical protein BKA70DRAFT_1222484 [Coprinopsis sp. MPI-PUGE-AT-0042]